MLSQEAIEDLKQDCTFEEIQEINNSLEHFEKTWIAYDIEEAFSIIKQNIFAKEMKECIK